MGAMKKKMGIKGTPQVGDMISASNKLKANNLKNLSIKGLI